MIRIITLLLFVILPTILSAQKAQFPVVSNFGGVYDIPEAIYPNPDMSYQIVIDLKTMQRDKESINPGLNNVARMMNLHGLGGVQKEDLEVIVIAHGSATDVILSNEAYRQRYELDNPNIPLITELEEAGVQVYVCGQSLLSRHYAHEEVNKEVSIGLSMLTVFTDYLHQGFVPLVFD